MSKLFSKVASRWTGLARRERVAVSFALLLLVFGSLDLFFVEPVAKSAKAHASVLIAKKNELSQAIRQRQDLTAEVDARRRDAAAGSAAVELSFSKLFDEGVLWRTAAANAWFMALIEKHGKSMTSVTIATEGAADPAYPGLYSHAIGFTGEMDWPELDGFMSELSKTKALRLDEVTVGAVDELGRGVEISVKATVLSDEKKWRGDREWTPAKGGA